MDEFGETPTIYIWPAGHEEGTPLPADFWNTVGQALADAGLEYEAV